MEGILGLVLQKHGTKLNQYISLIKIMAVVFMKFRPLSDYLIMYDELVLTLFRAGLLLECWMI